MGDLSINFTKNDDFKPVLDEIQLMREYEK